MINNYKSLIKHLSNIAPEIPTDISEDECEQLIKSTDEIHAIELKKLFGWEEASGSGYGLHVYAESEAHRDAIYFEMEKLGYKNIRTYVPLVDNGAGGTMPDPNPKHAWSVDAHSNYIFAYSESSQKLLNIIDKYMKPCDEEFIKTKSCDANTGQLEYTFKTKERADLALAFMMFQALKIADLASNKGYEPTFSFEEFKVSRKWRDVYSASFKVTYVD
ncbi:hypothetical protein AB6E94_19485 [Vibrio lentus]|uniref:hypothetical protein n=1 Tax=Vibrio splendidus TaxID=29497 RepID=UPI000C85DC8A|nr:hypothetical protein [Vibrio splendidus]PMG17885.1 hypothetical protein BCU98_00705 [Vibrio splendidus]